MAFAIANWACVSPSLNQGQETVTPFGGSATVLNAPNQFMYASATDNVAAISAANYFLSQYKSLSVGDWIMGNGSDASFSLVVTAVSSTSVTVVSSGLTTNIGTANIVDGAVTGVKMEALASGRVFVGSAGSVATPQPISGDATLAASGALTIANDAVTTAKILNANVTLAKLASGVTPSHIVKFAGQPTTAGGAAAEAIAVVGALVTDLAFVQMVDNGTNNVTIVDAVVTADTLTVTFSADPGNDAVINYQLLRAAS